ncbi:MAG: Calx-beta domain-containing protein [Accumulibacter sp.]|jgi:RHS repeat-associated protein
MATITLLDGNDLLNTGDEDDIIYAGGGNDTVDAGGGNDVLMGDTGDDLLAGGAGDDQLLGDAGSDRLYGGEGNDVLDGGTPFWTEDFLAGGPGDDTYVIEWNRDAVVEAPSEGVDLIRAAAGNYFFGSYTLPDGVENLDAGQVSGTTVRGNALDNVITGSSGNDQLYGLSGSDHLIGGDGGDTLIGDGEGSDSGQVSLYDVGRGVGGVRIEGEKANDYAGSSLAGLGDVNGDGYADIAVGASSAVYVLFGPFGNDWQINLNDAAAGIGGYKIVASGSEYIYGSITSAGDVNGDGLADLLIANYNDPEGGGGYSGAAFVVFGKADGGQIDLAQVAAGNGGFKIVGEYGNQYGYYYGDWAGYSLSAAGDLNADGNDDVLIGARWNDEGGYQAGAAYVVWGKADGLKVNLDDVANGVGGYKIVGESGNPQRADGPGDAAGESVAGVGDVNGDAIPDLLIGAPGHAASYLVYGKADNGKINLDDVAQGIGGFKISGAGSSVASGGDVNGDGRTDYLIGGSGVSYVVFGSATPGNVLLTEVGVGNGGYALNFGGSPVNLGDINRDGRDDQLVLNFNYPRSILSGVVYGKGSGVPVGIGDLTGGTTGFAVANEYSEWMRAMAPAGDVDADGIPDFLVSTAGPGNVGVTYVVLGKDAAHVRGDDLLEGGAGDDGLVGGGGNDTLIGGIGADTADYSGSAGAVMANLGVGMATQDGLGGADTLVDIENLNGSAHTDKLVGSALANALYGQSGDDELWAGAGADLLDGGTGNDVLGSDAGADTLTGGAGADHFVLLPGMEGETITDFVRGEDRIDVAGFGAVVADWPALRARIAYASGDARIDLGNSDVLTVKGMAVDSLTEADFVGLGALGERWSGAVGDDQHTGTVFDDVLDGLAGDDTLAGAEGDDVLAGDAGDDLLEGDIGNDRLEGNAGTDTVDGGPGTDTADYSHAMGSVEVDLSAGMAEDDGNLGRDTLIDIENVIGSSRPDYLIGDEGPNRLSGLAGNDVLKGLGGNDVLEGGPDNNRLEGGAGEDTLLGGSSADSLYGGEGNDVLDGGTPFWTEDFLAGGPGDDTYVIEWNRDAVVEAPSEGVDLIRAAAGNYFFGSYTLPDGVENLDAGQVSGTTVRGNALDNVITGSSGNDQLYGLSGSDHLIGGDGGDTLIGDGEGSDSGQVSLYDVGRGVGGVRIEGEKANDYAGSSLAGLGDVNGDGYADIAVGASSAVYVLFGPFGNDWQINLNDAAAGIGGYKIVASGSEYIYGSITSAGDVNGDGLADLLIANYNDPEGGGGYSGAAFVVFGKADGGQIDLAQVAAGNGGFKIVGEYGNQYGYYYGDWAGYSLSAAGDLNADGNDDVLIGARWNDEGGYQAGAAYVVWGKADGLKVNLDDVANGVGGYKIVGESGNPQRADGPGDAAGESVAGVGDVNGDAIPDLLIGAPGHAASYLVYGKADNGKINLDDVAQGIGGFKISGAGSSVASGGDVNGDGRTDYLIGGSGVSYVVFGSATPGNVLLTEVGVGNGGYALNFGGSPVNLGDINRDGRDDQLVLNFNYPRSILSGVVYGKGSGVPVGIGDLTGGTTGFAVANEYSEWMRAMAPAGDVDADGIPDFLVSTAGPGNVGVTYVVLGKDAEDVRGDDLLEGGAGDDVLSGGGGNDTLSGASGTDTADYSQAGGAVIVDLAGGSANSAGDGSHDTLTDVENVIGSAFNDVLSGTDGDNVLDGGGGRDHLTARAGNDILRGGTAEDTMDGGSGDDQLDGGSGDDILLGRTGNDQLLGGDDADSLDGGDGTDIVSGGAGTDTLRGGSGSDLFRDSLSAFNGDTIRDFSPEDALAVTGTSFATAALSFAHGVLGIDASGDGVPDAGITFEGTFDGRFFATQAVGNTSVVFIPSAELADLVVDSVTAPSDALPGQNTTITYTVRNAGAHTAIGEWDDSIYLSVDDKWNLDDVLVGRAHRSSDVAPGANYTASFTAPMPAVLPGDYHFIVRTNSLGHLREISDDNNLGSSTRTTENDWPVLAVGSSATGTLRTGQSAYYRVEVPAGETFLVSFDSASATASNELYASYDRVPTRSIFDAASGNNFAANQEILIRETKGGSYYVFAYGDRASVATDFTLSASLADFSIREVTPDRGSNRGQVTLSLDGVDFAPNDIVRIVASDGTERAATQVRYVDSGELWATFDLQGLTTGVYDVHVGGTGRSALADDAFTVTDGQPGRLQYSLSVPAAVRPGTTTTGTITYTNVGETDVAAPLVFLHGQGATYQIPGIAEERGSTVAYIGGGPGAPAGILPAGGTMRLPFNFTAFDSSNVVSHGLYSSHPPGFLFAPPGPVIDWASLKSTVKPEYVNDHAWGLVWDQLVLRVGDEVSELAARLADRASIAHVTHGATGNVSQLIESFTASVSELIQSELTEIIQSGPRTVLETATDFSFISTGPELGFARVFDGTLVGRNTAGSFGYGWSHSFDVHAITDSSGDVYIKGPASARFFDRVVDGSLVSYVEKGDGHGSLRAGASGYTLTETDGTRLLFSGSGDLVQILDRNGNAIDLQYNNGQLVHVGHTDGDSLTLTHNVFGKISTITDGSGRTVNYLYDATGSHLVGVQGARGTTAYSYDGGANALRKHSLISVAYADGTHHYLRYDDEGRLTGDSADGGGWLAYSYPETAKIQFTDATGVTTSVLYNTSLAPGQIVDGVGAATRFQYDADGSPTRLVSADNTVSSYAYDALGNLTNVVDPNGRTFSFSINPTFNSVASLTDQRGNVTRYEYDGNGNLGRVEYADGTTDRYVYDASGRVTEATNGRGQATMFAYDAQGRVTEKLYSDGTRLNYAWDAHDNLVSITDSRGVTTLQYDAADRLVSFADAEGRTVSYAYDAGGRRIQMTDPEGREIHYAYDAAGRLASLHDGGGDLIVNYTYDAAGRVLRVRNGNGTETSNAYDAAGRVTSVRNLASDGSVITEFHYTYDSMSRPVRVDGTDGQWTYRYDALGRVTGADLDADRDGSADRTFAYAYDAAGNRIRSTTDGSTEDYVANQLNQYSTVGPVSYQYDADGNLVEKTEGGQRWTYGYDSDNRLISLVTPSDNWTYEYDGLGNRVASVHDGVRTEYVIDPSGLGNVVGEYDSAGNLSATYTYGIGLVSRDDALQNAAYYAYDRLGNTSALTDELGRVVNRYVVAPFGDTLVSTELVENPFEFVGQYGLMAEQDGLTFMRARFYSSGLGRFLSQDPAGFQDGANLYDYVSGGATFSLDPSGLARVVMDVFAYGFYGGFILESSTGQVVINLGLGGSIGFAKNKIGFTPISWSFKVGESEGPIKYDNKIHFNLDKVGLGINPHTEEKDKMGSASASISARVYMNYPTDVGSIANGLTDMFNSTFPGWNSVLNKVSAVVRPRDPNDILGPAGHGDERWIQSSDALPYTIRFENASDATAAAQQVVVTQQLDRDLDWTSFRLGSFGWGDLRFDVPGDRPFYQARIDLSATRGFLVDVTAGIDIGTGLATWTLATIDPQTGEPTADVFAGFLPPNDSTGRGDGFVSYVVESRDSAPSGTVIDAIASIVFDTEAPIVTPAVFNTLDAGGPQSAVAPLPGVSDLPGIRVSWSGADDPGGAGIAHYTVYVTDNAGPPIVWLENTQLTEAVFTGEVGHTYGFFSVAIDHVGHVEPIPTTADTETFIRARIPTRLDLVVSDVDGDGLPDATRYEGNSGVTTFSFTVIRSSGDLDAASVSYAVTGAGPNPAGADDFAAQTLPFGTLEFAVGETQKTVTIEVLGDALLEFDEVFTLTLSAPVNAALGSATASVTILNDDVPPPEVSIVATDAARSEGGIGTSAFVFTITRTGDLSATSTVAYAVIGSGSNPASAEDFSGALPSGTVSFLANETSKTVTVDVSGDTTVEGDEGFTVTLNDPNNATIVIAAAEGTIVNDDALPPPTLAIAPLGGNKAEGNTGTTTFSFAVTRTGDTSGVTSVDYSVAGAGTQPADAADFGGALPSGTLTFAADEVEQVVTIAVTGDTAVELDEQFAVNLTNPGNAALAVASASATIENDDVLALPAVSIAAEQARLAEGNSGTTAFTFLLTRTGDLSAETSVSYSLSGAADANDFVGGLPPSGLVVFAPGSSEQRLTIDVSGDGQIEPHEGFTVMLHDPVNGTVDNGSAVATIVNDDTSSFKIGDAPARPPRSDAGAWERSWSHAGVTIAHKANLADANESYSNVLFASSGSGILAGGDVSGGDLGVSGQTLATSAVLQELDGSEGLRFVLDEEANQISFQLSRFTRNDDGTGFNEAGRLQLLDVGGQLVREIFFAADALDGSRQVTVALEEGFTQAIFAAGAHDGNDFIYGAYANQVGDGFGSNPFAASGAMHGSEYLIDSVVFTSGYVDLLWTG